RVGALYLEVAAGPRHGVNVYGQAEPRALSGDVPEQVVLQPLVLGTGDRARGAHLIDAFGFRSVDLLEAEGTQVSRLELLGDRSCLPVTLKRRSHHTREVLGKRRGSRLETCGIKVAAQKVVFECEKGAAIAVSTGETRVIEREHQRIGIGDPA